MAKKDEPTLVTAEIDEALLAKVLEESGTDSLTAAIEKMLLEGSEDEHEIKHLMALLGSVNALTLVWTEDGLIGLSALKAMDQISEKSKKTLIKILNGVIGQMLAEPEELKQMQELMQKGK